MLSSLRVAYRGAWPQRPRSRGSHGSSIATSPNDLLDNLAREASSPRHRVFRKAQGKHWNAVLLRVSRIYFFASKLKDYVRPDYKKESKMRRKFLLLTTLIGILTTCSLPSLAKDTDTVLRGRVYDQGKRDHPGLRREDLAPDQTPTEDPQIFEPTKDMMRMEGTPAPPRPPFSIRADENGQAPLQPMDPTAVPIPPFMGTGEDLPPMPFQQQPPPGQINYLADPDLTPEMQLLWDIWHHRVAEAIYMRFNYLAKVAFKCSPPLLCKVCYTVTRDGRIQNIQVQEKSPNILFNLIVCQTVKSLDGDAALLQYPPNSRRMVVAKNGTFTQNYGGDGFKYTIGDRETVPWR